MNETANAAGHWSHFAHEADTGVCGTGATKDAAFEHAALAMTAVITDPNRVECRTVVDITCEAPDDGLLLADWLNALIYEMATRRMLFGRFQVKISGARLRGRAWGEPVDITKHQPAVEVKGATLTELSVAQDGSGNWVARCVVDV
jgi:tRNA nucleotidyltransferase (CCA-adding enzyme)